ncbi:unnamed protein product [Clavelina lepadiformis]|uniref:Uncharacterized protein n=1 Tax=Clavelina lepadiformis TaxID=159417 RepID=A0ABP0GNY5_CLALP
MLVLKVSSYQQSGLKNGDPFKTDSPSSSKQPMTEQILERTQIHVSAVMRNDEARD